jgi:hypothetical protein
MYFLMGPFTKSQTEVTLGCNSQVVSLYDVDTLRHNVKVRLSLYDVALRHICPVCRLYLFLIVAHRRKYMGYIISY